MRKRSHEAALVTMGAIAVALFFTYPLLSNFSQIGPGPDWDVFAESTWVSSYSVTHFGQLPQWDPYKCGGVPLLADPQSRIFTPFFLFHILFNPIGALRLDFIIHLAVAWAGGYFLGRILELGYLPASICALVFPSSSWIYLHYAAGHLSFIGLLYLPWILGTWLYGVETRKLLPLVAGGLVCAVAFAESGIYVAYLSAPLIAVIAITNMIERRRAWPLYALLVMGLFAVGFASIKLLPVLALQIDRPNESLEVENFGMLVQELFSRDQDMYRWLPGIAWGFYEYGAYVGPVVGALAILGAGSNPRRALAWLAGAVASIALSVGSPTWWAPWTLLHQVPFYKNEHVPSRFLIPFVMALAPLAGIGAAAIVAWRRWSVAVVALLFLVAVTDFWVVDRGNLRHATEGAQNAHRWSAVFRQFWDVTDRQTFAVALSNQGALSCYAMNIPGLRAHAYNRPDYRGEQYLTSPGSLSVSKWSPNTLEYLVDTKTQTILVVNQNYYPGWQLVEGKGELFSLEGLIAVRLPAGRQHLELTFHSMMFRLGAMITFATFGLSLMLYLWEARKRG